MLIRGLSILVGLVAFLELSLASWSLVDGYAWPENDRSYWPTISWQTAAIEDHGLDAGTLAAADDQARKDPNMRALLVVKDGMLVFERYYHGGAADQSTEIWSATKSVISALLGITLKRGEIESIDEPMVRYLVNYPAFGSLTIRQVLEHTTGLAWSEQGEEFVGWIASDDWIENALSRERLHAPGTRFLYSSGNSHFLSALIKAATGMTPGEYAKKHLFAPLGIRFGRDSGFDGSPSWEGFLVRTSNTWKQDPTGLEVGAFGLSMTAREMAKFGFLYLNRGRWDGEQIIPVDWVEESTRDYHQRSENFAFGHHWVVARRGGQLAFNADGWGGQIICVVPALDMVIVIKSDAENPGGHPYYDILDSVIEAASK